VGGMRDRWSIGGWQTHVPGCAGGMGTHPTPERSEGEVVQTAVFENCTEGDVSSYFPSFKNREPTAQDRLHSALRAGVLTPSKKEALSIQRNNPLLGEPYRGRRVIDFLF